MVAAARKVMPCAGDNTVAALVAGALDPTAVQALEHHLDTCASCRKLVADLGRGLSALERMPAAGDCIGRYELVRTIGVGGMGVVFEAHDRVLARRVALKLLRPDRACAPSLLLAEARALARLSHRNVVAIHDAGSANGRVYLCMEYIAGTTLRGWLDARARTRREIVDAFLTIGRGLAYIHDEGIAHLDFKPDNVLVERGGRMVVTDFGVAALARDSGAIAGTPRYMAPEQRAGRRVDERADQYAFCVALGEALGAHAPRAIQHVIERGMQDRADARFASMAELCAALAAAHARTRRRITTALAVATSLALAIALVRSPQTITRVIAGASSERVIEREVTGDRHARTDHDAPVSVRAIELRTALAELASSVGFARGRAASNASSRANGDALDPTVGFASAFASTLDRDAGACDDGAPRTCSTEPPPWCPAGSTLALQAGCWTCADEHGCAPLGSPHVCDDGSPLRCTRARPTCSGRELPSVIGGCWECADPFTCGARSSVLPVLPVLPDRCGDGTCDPGESRASCPSDCGADGHGTGSGAGSGHGHGSGHGSGSGGGGHCGNLMCEVGEDHASCPSDCCETTGSGGCVPVCNNGFCEIGEDHASCPSDCCETSGSGGCV